MVFTSLSTCFKPGSNQGTTSTQSEFLGINIHQPVELVGGWALPFWKMMDLVSWDDEIPNIWWLFPTEWKVIKVEKYELVSWDDDIPNWMESHKSHVPNMSKPPTRSTFINQEACHQQPLLPRSVCQGTARGGFLNSSISSSAASAFTSAAGERHGHVSCFYVLLCVCVSKLYIYIYIYIYC